MSTKTASKPKPASAPSQTKPTGQPVASAAKIQSPRLMTNSETPSRLFKK